MDRSSFVLAALAPSGLDTLTPVQVQKLFFLLDKNIADQIGGEKFDFTPYNYGPYDSNVYNELNALAKEGLAVTEYGSGNWRTYRLTAAGLTRAMELSQELPPRARNYIEEASRFVRSLSFSELVRAIYKKYPEMSANSVFQG